MLARLLYCYRRITRKTNQLGSGWVEERENFKYGRKSEGCGVLFVFISLRSSFYKGFVILQVQGRGIDRGYIYRQRWKRRERNGGKETGGKKYSKVDLLYGRFMYNITSAIRYHQAAAGDDGQQSTVTAGRQRNQAIQFFDRK